MGAQGQGLHGDCGQYLVLVTDSDGKTSGENPRDVGCQPEFVFQTLIILPMTLTGFCKLKVLTAQQKFAGNPQKNNPQCPSRDHCLKPSSTQVFLTGATGTAHWQFWVQLKTRVKLSLSSHVVWQVLKLLRSGPGLLSANISQQQFKIQIWLVVRCNCLGRNKGRAPTCPALPSLVLELFTLVEK